jgi:hypothetical protein
MKAALTGGRVNEVFDVHNHLEIKALMREAVACGIHLSSSCIDRTDEPPHVSPRAREIDRRGEKKPGGRGA